MRPPEKSGRTSLELISLAKEFGVESENMTRFIEDSMDRLQQVVEERQQLLGRVAQDGARQLAALVEAGFANTPARLQTAARAAEAFFAEMIASGMSFQEAIEALGPSLLTIGEKLEETGAVASPTFQAMLDGARLFADEGLRPILERGVLAGNTLQALSTLGRVTAGDFATLGAEIRGSFTRLVDGGATGAAAMEALRPQLALLIKLQEEFGFTVDAGTQKLIDQAKEHGITADEAVSAEERQLEALDKMIAALNQIVELLGGVTDEVNELDGTEAEVKITADDSEVRAAIDKVPSRIKVPVEFGGEFDIELPRRPQFQIGTPNLDFMDHGPARQVEVHGREAIIPEGGGHQLAGEIAESLAPLLEGGGGRPLVFNATNQRHRQRRGAERDADARAREFIGVRRAERWGHEVEPPAIARGGGVTDVGPLLAPGRPCGRRGDAVDQRGHRGQRLPLGQLGRRGRLAPDEVHHDDRRRACSTGGARSASTRCSSRCTTWMRGSM